MNVTESGGRAGDWQMRQSNPSSEDAEKEDVVALTDGRQGRRCDRGSWRRKHGELAWKLAHD